VVCVALHQEIFHRDQNEDIKIKGIKKFFGCGDYKEFPVLQQKIN